MVDHIEKVAKALLERETSTGPEMWQVMASEPSAALSIYAAVDRGDAMRRHRIAMTAPLVDGGTVEHALQRGDRATAPFRDIWSGVFPGCFAGRYRVPIGCTTCLKAACSEQSRLTRVPA